MKLWIDGDACPGAVRDIVMKAAIRHSLELVLVANKPISVPAVCTFVQVGQGPDVVDQYIIAHAQAGDLVISQDIPLAAELVAKGVMVISPHGTLFSEHTIGERLAVRNLAEGLRDTGQLCGGPKPYGEKEKRQFANTFDQVLTRLLKTRPKPEAG